MFSVGEILTIINSILIIIGWFVVSRREKSKIILPRRLGYIDEIISGLKEFNRSFSIRMIMESPARKHLASPISKSESQKITIDMLYYDSLAKVFCSKEVSDMISNYVRKAIELIDEKNYHEDRSNEVISMFADILMKIEKEIS